MKKTKKPKLLVQDQYENQRQYNSYQEQFNINNSGYTIKDLIELSLKPLETKIDRLEQNIEQKIIGEKENKKFFWGCIIIPIICSIICCSGDIINFLKKIINLFIK